MDWHDDATLIMTKSAEILDHIAQEPNFAEVVKSIVVLGFSPGEVVFERRCLAKSLRALPNLRSFHWFGSGPGLPFDIAKSLSTHCSQLEEISLPRFAKSSAHALGELTQLKKLQLVPPNACFTTVEDEFGDVADVIRIMDSTSTTLRKLALLGDCIGHMSVRLFTSLTHLELSLSHGAGLSGLDLVFQHATRLESLAMTGFIHPDIFPMLKNNSSALPYLTSFRLFSLHADGTDENWRDLTQFLEKQVLLRRLCLRLSGKWRTISTVLPVIGEMSNLRVLGLDTGHKALAADEFAYLASHLSPRLRALNIDLHFPANIADMAPLLHKVEQLPSLFFLNLGVDAEAVLAISPEDLASGLKHLGILGLNRCLWNIDRWQREIVLSKWSARKTKYCVGQDFGSEDEEWLIKYQAQNPDFKF